MWAGKWKASTIKSKDKQLLRRWWKVLCVQSIENRTHNRTYVYTCSHVHSVVYFCTCIEIELNWKQNVSLSNMQEAGWLAALCKVKLNFCLGTKMDFKMIQNFNYENDDRVEIPNILNRCFWFVLSKSKTSHTVIIYFVRIKNYIIRLIRLRNMIFIKFYY